MTAPVPPVLRPLAIGPSTVSTNTLYTLNVTSGSTATQMTAGALTQGLTITVPASSTETVYIGPAGVTTATGYPVAAGGSISLNVANANQVYYVSGAGTGTIQAIGL